MVAIERLHYIPKLSLQGKNDESMDLSILIAFRLRYTTWWLPRIWQWIESEDRVSS